MNIRLRIVSIILFYSAIQSSFAQSFPIGHSSVTFTDPTRSNRQIPCEVYYPAQTAGDNTEVADGIFPVLALGHGFVMTWTAYQIYPEQLVPAGYIMILPTTESSFFPSHEDFGKDLAFVCSAMISFGASDNSQFSGHVASTNAVMGHSMGGGSSFLAMQYDNSISAMVSFAAAETNPSAIAAAAEIDKPVLVFSGLSDCVAPPADNQIPMYEALASDCKNFIGITGGDHCQFASSNFNCSFGQSTCSTPDPISSSEQQNIVMSLLLPWLNFHLKNDCISGNEFENLLTSLGNIVTNQTCELTCSETLIGENTEFQVFQAYPNPFNASFEIINRESEKTAFTLLSATGSVVTKGLLNPGSTSINTEQLSCGVYFLKIENQAVIKLVK